MSSTAENDFKAALQQTIFSCATSLDALKASRSQVPQTPEDNPSPEDVRSDFISILTLLYARSTSLTLVLNADSYSAAREPLIEIARDVSRLAHYNRASVAKRWQSDASHIDDAMREVKEMIEEAESDDPVRNDEEDFEDGWGEILGDQASKLATHEVETAKKVMLILRMVALLHKRVLSRIISPALEGSLELEQLLGFSTGLAGGVDDIAASLWSPQDSQQISNRAAEIRKKTQALRETLHTSGIIPSETG
ncbi:Grap2/cyclin-D-interacting protein [Rhizoctonia solani]|uniref:Grap2/cyclin-D-interacting protein n=1 Tax=Rhizoctonia solani TaxID=456999 RepID=A0A8H8SS27_9AGAM|nr:Grap2/cyclin-D-interacting protein [Rhizoctonia solani]QRW16164.1 Grap2/cyclin-D-interacting protein [Rhizoctonia solani]